MENLPQSCDIFCAVVDNYGDIGVSWRLARQLVQEHGIQVRLWVDDMASFAKLCPELDISQEVQMCREVEVRHWQDKFPDVQPADLVIEAFACKLPDVFVAAMAAQVCKPVWLNLEYLSAEEWVEGAHKLPSPHPYLPLTKYFFFPGFTSGTGGLLLERDALARRDAFQTDLSAQQSFWRGMGVPERKLDEVRVSLFSYENDAVTGLLRAWETSATPVLCCVPEGRVLPQVQGYFGKVASSYQSGNLRVQVLPFVEQERYDELLWACDINFVRGEDSCVRAQWAGKPFVWHIYPQHDGVHRQKLQALSALYGDALSGPARQAVEQMWQAWSGEGEVATAWSSFIVHQTELQTHAREWSTRLAKNALALNLLDFYREVANA